MTIKRFSQPASNAVPTRTAATSFALDGHADFFAKAALNSKVLPSELTLVTPDRIRLHTKTSRTTNTI